jgi:hypothetical protein
MLVKLAKQNTNKAKDSLRRVRTDAINKLKKSKDKTSEDTVRLIEKQVLLPTVVVFMCLTQGIICSCLKQGQLKQSASGLFIHMVNINQVFFLDLAPCWTLERSIEENKMLLTFYCVLGSILSSFSS